MIDSDFFYIYSFSTDVLDSPQKLQHFQGFPNRDAAHIKHLRQIPF